MNKRGRFFFIHFATFEGPSPYVAFFEKCIFSTLKLYEKCSFCLRISFEKCNFVVLKMFEKCNLLCCIARLNHI